MAIEKPIGWNAPFGVKSAVDVFLGYLMLDAWIANQDRHHENWGIILMNSQGTYHLAPTYDHASSLGTGETDETRQDKLTATDSARNVEGYVQKARSAFYETQESPKTLPTLDTFAAAAKRHPNAARHWLDRLKGISQKDVDLLFEALPETEISPVAASFARKMLYLNQGRLLSLIKD
jgi:hypothetical protein